MGYCVSAIRLHYHKPDHSKLGTVTKISTSISHVKRLALWKFHLKFIMGIWLHFSARDIAWPWRNVAQQNAKSKLQNMQNCWLSGRKKQRSVAKKKLNDVALLPWGTRSHLAKAHLRNKCYFKIEWEIKGISSVCLVSFVLNIISVSMNFSYPHRWHNHLALLIRVQNAAYAEWVGYVLKLQEWKIIGTPSSILL